MDWRIFHSIERPAVIDFMPANFCWANSAWTCRTWTDLRYAEGIAWVDSVPLLHAWVVDPEGLAIDVTLPNPAELYIGRTFDDDTIEQHLEAGLSVRQVGALTSKEDTYAAVLEVLSRDADIVDAMFEEGYAESFASLLRNETRNL